MLLVRWNSQTRQVYLARQKPDFKFSRLDSYSGSHMWGKEWISLSRYQVGPKEWTQVGPLNMVQWVD